MPRTAAPVRRVFFFVHVPKCAGSTFRSVLRRNFQVGYVEEYRLLEPRELRYRAEDLSRLLDYLPRLRCFSGHCLSCDLPYERRDVEVIGLAAVRDPVERILSWYAFNRNTHHYDLVEKHQDLGTYLDFLLDGYDFQADPWRLCQVPDLVDLAGEAGLHRIAELARRDRLFLFPMSRFDDTMAWLERRWPTDFPNTAYAGRENVSHYDQALDPALGERLARLAAHPAIAIDARLVDFAHAQLDQRIAELPGESVDFVRHRQDYARRCQRSRRFETWLRAPLRRVRLAANRPSSFGL